MHNLQRSIVAVLCMLLCAMLTQLHSVSPKHIQATARVEESPIEIVRTFTSDLGGWMPLSGTTVNCCKSRAVMNGSPNRYTSMYYMFAAFGELDYSVSFRRTGCSTCISGLIVHGYPFYLDRGQWDTGFEFGLDNHGYYRIYKRMTGITLYQSIIKPKTFSPYVQYYGTNTLRVIARNHIFRFYINNHLVFTYVDTSRYLDYGEVGIFMASPATVSSDYMYIRRVVIRSWDVR